MIKDTTFVSKAQLSGEGTTSDTISRQAAIDALKPLPTIEGLGLQPLITVDDVIKVLNGLPSVQPDKSCDGCRYENADDGVLVPCGFCKRSHPDNYERRSDGTE